MMRALRISAVAAALVCAVAPAVYAELTIENKMLQSGLYVNPQCKPVGIEGFNECACLADVHYPALSGLASGEKEKQLNDAFIQMAEKQKCEGRESQAETESKDEPASSTFNFEVTYQSPKLLGLRFESWAFAGGAHGGGSVGGVLVDLQQVKAVALSEIFAKKDLPELNKYIYDALSAEPEGEVFHDAIEGFGGVFITDTECKSCTVVLANDGLKVVFQTYAVASYANGPMEVMIPEKFASYPVLAEALKNIKPASPETQTDASPVQNSKPSITGGDK